MAESGPRIRVLGVRHHGPGSARAVRAALAELQPRVVLIEGPPEADALVRFVADEELRPPVALLGYRNDDPSKAAFWPLAVFSPEWQALSWAVRNGAGVRFMDLPAANVLADPAPGPEALPVDDQPGDDQPGDDHGVDDHRRSGWRTDPIAVLARAGGYDDPERWWDDVIESRADGDPFDAVAEAMAAVREAAPPERDPEDQLTEDRREAHMRKMLRAVIKEGHDPIAVVCGAWHAPALSGKLPPATRDNQLLRGMPKAKVTLAWVPWTHSRLGLYSGYGAGVESPGWYHHLFTAPDRVVERWMTRAAGVLRDHDLPTSSAHVIEAVRLADSLAALRGRPLAGLAEVGDAVRSVLCEGSEVAAGIVLREAVIGEQLGTVPDGAPTVPLEADFRAAARAARLKPAAEEREIVLDLRGDLDRRRSVLLHRLVVLGIDWGEPIATGGLGTFKEGWLIAWRPELSVRLVEASLWGTTVAGAAGARLLRRTDTLASITGAIAAALTAELPEVLPPLLRELDARAARTNDVADLLDAVVPLAEAQRYGTVRGTDTAELARVARALLSRACAGLGAALAGLAEDAAADARERIDRVHRVVALLPGADVEWYAALAALLGRADLPAGIAGRVVRMLLDGGRIDGEEAARRLHAALSIGTPAAEKALWAEGFLAGGPLLLIHDERLLRVLDAWLAELGEDDFVETLPMLRRTFGRFAPAERRELNRVADRLAEPAAARADTEVDPDHAGGVLATVKMIIGGGP
ncbi:hypothetical protein GGQ54_001933 [Naumannella cuiyingiana]|uniref:Uncharacterized protein n=1 Tax=Naumannella cuiyingiana TaxID=1347891 RepID=A0A7Z0IL95_9ACTN|nr:DUF5682 family protein [Naumannella cuiyingiana]NYI71373.1 hypothetical protein [Naumannella cuiyingiana]